MRFKNGHRRITLSTFAFLAALFMLVGQSAAFPGEPPGFDGYNWGTPREKFGAMRYVGTDETGNALYERPGSATYYGRALITAVELGFKDGRLAAVTLRVNSLLQYLLMKEEALRRYGKGEEIAGQKDSYVWSGEKSVITLVGHFTDS